MKKVLLTVAAVFVTLSIYAQGTIDFKNDAATHVRVGLKGNASAVSADNVYVALYWAPLSNPDNFQQLGAAVKVAGNPPVAGLFFGGTRTTGNQTAPGDVARFIVRAWEFAYGTTYEAAAAAPNMNGRPAQLAQTPVFTLATGGGGTPPSNPAALVGTTSSPGFTGATVNPVPEPSIIALGVLGVGSLLLFRRRK